MYRLVTYNLYRCFFFQSNFQELGQWTFHVGFSIELPIYLESLCGFSFEKGGTRGLKLSLFSEKQGYKEYPILPFSEKWGYKEYPILPFSGKQGYKEYQIPPFFGKQGYKESLCRNFFGQIIGLKYLSDQKLSNNIILK